jgi:gamma-glutamyltranspeptidase/glutathione hydrolase
MYTGPLAEEIVATVTGNALAQGLISLEDLRNYQPEKSVPLCSPYRQWTVCGPQLPSSGGLAVQQILGIASAFDLDRDDMAGSIHILAEASRLAFADRDLYLADPKYVSVPVDALLSPDYLRERASLIRRDRSIDSVVPGQPQQLAAWDYAPSPPSELASTSHFSIVDQWGDAVSMTTSVQSTFGSQLMVGGFLLNNQLTDFVVEPMSNGRLIANRPEGGKRPLSSMSPSFVIDSDERLRLVVGSPGGTRIIGYVVQAIVGLLDFGYNVQEAVAAPHFLARFDTLEIEERSDLVDMTAALQALGNDVQARTLNSGLHAIEIQYDTDGQPTLYGGVDPRREGIAIGD